MQQLRDHIAKTFLSVLQVTTEVKDGTICKPKEYFESIYRMQSTLIGMEAYRKLMPEAMRTTSFSEVFTRLEASFSPDCAFVRDYRAIRREERKALTDFWLWFRTMDGEKPGLSDLYEMMLSIEFSVESKSLSLDTGKTYDSIGSFYTPIALADKMVELCLDGYILKNTGIEGFSTSTNKLAQTQEVAQLLMHSTFGDHSCGTGSFLLAILRYCKQHLSLSSPLDLKPFVLNFRGVEADPISLEIARFQLLEYVGDTGIYAQLSKNLLLGNPLIQSDPEGEDAGFHHEFYYHNGLAMDADRIDKCDVIIANPPWGTVNFDLAFFLNLTCPAILELENVNEMEQAVEELEDSHPQLYDWLLKHDEASDLAAENIYNDERFNHSVMGGLQTNLLFTELTDQLLSERGVAALILKSSTLSDPTNKRLWNHLVNRKRVIARYDLINCNKIFNIDRTEEFSMLLLGQNDGSEFKHLKGLSHLDELI